jgi:hypothetical protein
VQGIVDGELWSGRIIVPATLGMALRRRISRSGGFQMTKKWAGLAALLALLLASAAGVARAEISDADAKALHDYRLSMDKVKRFAAASKALDQAEETDAGLKAEETQMSSETQGTLADLRTSLAHHPRIAGYFTSQKLSADDAILIPITLMGAHLATAIPAGKQLPPSVSAVQVDFVKQHKAELAALPLMKPQDQ